MKDISKQLSNATFQKNSILFIDNIDEIDLLECIEFANAFINCNNSNQVVIAVDSNDDEFHICPGKFGENEIELLANSYNIELAKKTDKKSQNYQMDILSMHVTVLKLILKGLRL